MAIAPADPPSFPPPSSAPGKIPARIADGSSQTDPTAGAATSGAAPFPASPARSDGAVDTVMLAITRYFAREPLGVATRLALTAVGRALGVHGLVVQDRIAADRPVIGCAWHATESPHPHLGRLLSSLPQARQGLEAGTPWRWQGIVDAHGRPAETMPPLRDSPLPLEASAFFQDPSPVAPEPSEIPLPMQKVHIMATPVPGDPGPAGQVAMALVSTAAPNDTGGNTRGEDTSSADAWHDNDQRLLAFVAEMYALALGRSRERSARIEIEHRLDSFTSNLPGSVWRRLLRTDGRLEYVYLSAGTTYLTEVNPALAKANPQLLKDAIHPDDFPGLRDSVLLSARLLTDWVREFRILSKTGQVRWVHASGKVQQLPDGTVAWDGITLDITDRKRSEQALRESEARFRSAFNEAAEGMALISPSGRWLRVNRSLSTVLGAPPERIAGTSVTRWLPPQDRTVFQDMLRRATESGGPGLEGELRVLRGGSGRLATPEVPDSQHAAGDPLAAPGRHLPLDPEIWIHIKAAPVRTEDNALLYWIAHAQDVSARRATEALLVRARVQAEATARAKSDFLAMMSHEIRTPLSGMIGLARLLQDGTLTAEQARDVGRIESSARLLLTLLDDVLTLSKAEAGHGVDAPRPFSPGGLVSEVMGLLRPNASRKGLALISDLDPALPDRLDGPTLAIRQILFNLVGNAIKFTQGGSVTVRAGLIDTGDDPTMLRISVRDTGPGVREDEQDQIFEPFCQGSVSLEADPDAEHGKSGGVGPPPILTQKPEGVGLGLTICRRLAQEAGGEIGVANTPTGGAVFTVTLPVRRSTGAITAPSASTLAPVPAVGAAAQTGGTSTPRAQREPGAPGISPGEPPGVSPGSPAGAQPPAPTARDAERPLVFVVDDDDINREVMEASLLALGCSARAFAGGQALLATARAWPDAARLPDLVLMDLTMPGLSGPSATRRLHALSPPWSRIPVLAVTALAAHCPPETCEQSGISECLTKPVETATLIDVLTRWVPERFPPRNSPAPPSPAPPVPNAEDRPPIGTAVNTRAATPLVDDALWSRRVALLGIPRLSDRVEDLRDLGRGVHTGTDDEAAQAHKLAGAAATLGAPRLAAAARALETALEAIPEPGRATHGPAPGSVSPSDESRPLAGCPVTAARIALAAALDATIAALADRLRSSRTDPRDTPEAPPT